MSVIGRSSAALVLLAVFCSAPAFAVVAPPAYAARAKKTDEAPARAIVIAINGEELPRDPAPRTVGGHLMVPVVRIYSALGIDVSRDGDEIVAMAPSKRITLHLNSTHATIDQRSVTLETAAREIDGATYVPLRFVADSLGAYVTYDARGGRVEVVSSLVGRNPGLEQRTASGLQLNGSVTAVDLASAPEAITVAGRNGDVRTVSITSDARVLLQDTVARTSTDGTLADVRPGDAVSIVLRKDGRVADIDVRYATRSGTIAAASGSAFVLRDGFVVTPDRSTIITLDGQKASIGDLHVGDTVTIRINPDTLEKRQIVALRSGAAPPSPAAGGASPVAVAVASGATPSATHIDSVAITGPRAFHGGETLNVVMTGTPGGRATFDIGSYATAVAMTETKPGTYTGTWPIPANADLGAVAAIGHLSAGGSDAPKLVSSQVAIASTPPQLLETAPKAGEPVSNDKPSIFATYRSPGGIAIDPKSVKLEVNGADVTSAATATDGFVTYSPPAALAAGPVSVKVSVSDVARNTTTRSWTFTIVRK